MTKLSSKDKTKNGSGSLFAAYLANMNMPGTISKGNKTDRKDREKSYKVNYDTILGKDVPFPDSMTTEFLIRYIATEHEWFEDQTKSDISILINNRLFTVKDLRVLSKESWKQLDLLPFTKDLLREAINRGKLSTEGEYLKKKERPEKRKERRSSRETTISIASTAASVDNTNKSGAKSNKTDIKNFKKEAMNPTSPSSKNEPSNKLEVTKHPIRSSPQSQPPQSQPPQSQPPQLQPPQSQPPQSQPPQSQPPQSQPPQSQPPQSQPPQSQPPQSQPPQSPTVSPKNFQHIKHNSTNSSVKNSLVVDANQTIATKSTTKTTTKMTTIITDPVSNSDKSGDVKRFMPKPNKIPVGENRLKIRADDGKYYEIDRYCPHAGSDLFSRGAIVGSKLICSKHRWIFSLEEGGVCLSGGTGTLNACSVNDW